MNRAWIIIPVIAGILALGCPSEPDPPVTVSNPDWQVIGGICEIDITDFTIRKDYQYEISLVVQVDEWLWGKGVTGRLFGIKTGETEASQISAAISPTPGAFREGTNEYSWVFKAWENAIAGETQYLRIDIPNMAPSTSYGVKGDFISDEIDAFWDDFEYRGVIDTVGTTASAKDPRTGRGNIEAGELTKLETAKPGSYLEFTIENCRIVYIDPATLEPGEDPPSWGKLGLVASPGEYTMYLPETATVARQKFKYRILVSDALAKTQRPATQSPYLFVNPYNESVIKKCVLWEAK